jgi:hypothetical protein
VKDTSQEDREKKGKKLEREFLLFSDLEKKEAILKQRSFLLVLFFLGVRDPLSTE